MVFLHCQGLLVEWDKEALNAGHTVTVPQTIYKKGCLMHVDDALKSANTIGFPVMIKASEGGGGKGIRKATNADEFPNLFRQVS